MTPQTVSRTEEPYFATVTAEYDRLQPIVAGPGYEAGLAMLVDLVPFDRTAEFRFIDLGSGTGALAQRLLQRFPAARGVCIDANPAMLRVARVKLAGFEDRLGLRQGDLADCPIGLYDLAVSSMAFHHVPPDRLAETFGRVARALRPGGCLLLLDQMTAGPAWGMRVGAQRRRLHERHQAGWIAAGTATPEEVAARWDLKRRMKQQGLDVEYRHSAEGLLEAMSHAGFAETGLVWRMFATTILMGFVP